VKANRMKMTSTWPRISLALTAGAVTVAAVTWYGNAALARVAAARARLACVEVLVGSSGCSMWSNARPELRTDPWGEALVCRSTDRGAYVHTLGLDGAEGGTGLGVDTFCWPTDKSNTCRCSVRPPPDR
jgi:hypothetical protein